MENNIEENKKELLVENFKGTSYRLTNNWYDFIPLSLNENPIKYLEIGTFYGANIISCTKSYGSHPKSLLYGVDPYADYNEYDEYKNEITNIYETMKENLNLLAPEEKKKITIFREYSYDKIPKFMNDYFDIIYIDGNHLPEYVLEDAALSFRKLKVNGYMVFDDYGWNGEDGTKRGIDAFLHAFRDRIQILGGRETQVFIKRIK